MADKAFDTPDHKMFRDTVRRFVETEMVPRAREFDAANLMDKSLFKRMGDLGMLGLRYDPAYGGAGLDWSYTQVMYEEMGRSDNAGATLGVSVHTDMATPSLAEFGSDELKRQFLVPAIAGETVGAIAVTEPDAGSDVSAIKTRAVRDGDDWVDERLENLHHQRNANADWLCLLAVTDPDGRLQRDSPRSSCRPTCTGSPATTCWTRSGSGARTPGQFYFEDVRVPVANTIGEVGRGFQQQMLQFQHERLVACISTIACRRCRCCGRRRRSWTEERVLFGKPLSPRCRTPSSRWRTCGSNSPQQKC